ncbi:hypothetical protein MMPV_002436 [Pyropia vietnamensis]
MGTPPPATATTAAVTAAGPAATTATPPLVDAATVASTAGGAATAVAAAVAAAAGAAATAPLPPSPSAHGGPDRAGGTAGGLDGTAAAAAAAGSAVTAAAGSVAAVAAPTWRRMTRSQSSGILSAGAERHTCGGARELGSPDGVGLDHRAAGFGLDGVVANGRDSQGNGGAAGTRHSSGGVGHRRNRGGPDGGDNGGCTATQSPPRQSGGTSPSPVGSSSLPGAVGAFSDAPDAPVEPFLIGVSGASASGKTTVCDNIIDGLGDHRCVSVSLDWFYHGLPPGTSPAAYNFDHPNAFDFIALRETLSRMRAHTPVEVPVYDFATHSRVSGRTVVLPAADVVIVEGILAFYDPAIRALMHMKVFVDEDADVCLSRRIRRDVATRGRSVESVLDQYGLFVKPAFENYILPTKRYADIILPRGGDNHVAIDLIIKHIALKLRQVDLRKIHPNLVLLGDSYQVRGLHTIFRAAETSREDVVFYSNRLTRLVVEEGLGLLPFARKVVTTPTGGEYHGVGFVAGLAAVSLVRGGEAMELSLRAVCKAVKIGKILIGVDAAGGRSVAYARLPDDIQRRNVLVLEPILATGATVECAVDHLVFKVGCREEDIIVLSLVCSAAAVRRVCSRFPRTRLVTSAVDRHVDARGQVVPGVGNFADRYFGT